MATWPCPQGLASPTAFSEVGEAHERKTLAPRYGARLYFIVHYFLADNTVEINMANSRNSGRDPYPAEVSEDFRSERAAAQRGVSLFVDPQPGGRSLNRMTPPRVGF